MYIYLSIHPATVSIYHFIYPLINFTGLGNELSPQIPRLKSTNRRKPKEKRRSTGIPTEVHVMSICRYVSVCQYVHVSVCQYVRVHVSVCQYVHVYMCLFVSMYTCVLVSMYTSIVITYVSHIYFITDRLMMVLKYQSV